MPTGAMPCCSTLLELSRRSFWPAATLPLPTRVSEAEQARLVSSMDREGRRPASGQRLVILVLQPVMRVAQRQLALGLGLEMLVGLEPDRTFRDRDSSVHLIE